MKSVIAVALNQTASSRRPSTRMVPLSMRVAVACFRSAAGGAFWPVTPDAGGTGEACANTTTGDAYAVRAQTMASRRLMRVRLENYFFGSSNT